MKMLKYVNFKNLKRKDFRRLNYWKKNNEKKLWLYIDADSYFYFSDIFFIPFIENVIEKISCPFIVLFHEFYWKKIFI